MGLALIPGQPTISRLHSEPVVVWKDMLAAWAASENLGDVNSKKCICFYLCKFALKKTL